MISVEPGQSTGQVRFANPLFPCSAAEPRNDPGIRLGITMQSAYGRCKPNVVFFSIISLLYKTLAIKSKLGSIVAPLFSGASDCEM